MNALQRCPLMANWATGENTPTQHRWMPVRSTWRARPSSVTTIPTWEKCWPRSTLACSQHHGKGTREIGVDATNIECEHVKTNLKQFWFSRMYRSIQLKWRHCYNSVISEWNWIFQLLQRPSGKSLPIWPLRGWKPCASEAQWSWQTKSSVPPTHGLRPTPWTTPTTLAHSWCIFFDFLGTWHFD